MSKPRRAPEEILAAARKLASKGKIELAKNDRVTALDPYVQKVLGTIGHAIDVPGMEESLVTDLSFVSDFFDSCASPDERAQQAVAISRALAVLGVEIDPKGRTLICEVAEALAASQRR